MYALNWLMLVSVLPLCVCSKLQNSVLFTDPQMRELEIPKSVAERSLREHKGDLIKALHSLTD